MKRVQGATSRMRGALVCGLIISGFSTMNCGGGGLGTPVSQFPSREALDSAADDNATPSPSGKMIELDQWQMLAPGAELDAVNKSLTDGLSQRLGSSDKAKFSPELACAAREAARIYAEHDALPDFGLQDYLVMRCGGSALSVQLAVAYIETRPEQSDSQVQSGMQKFTDDMIDEGLQGPHIAMGIGFARGAARAATVIAYGSLAAEIKYAPVLATGNEFKISGASFEPADSILGVITSGQYGVALCQPDRSVKLPKFVLTCPMKEEDQQVTFSVNVGHKGRVLMTPLARAMVRRSDEVGLSYQPTSFGSVTEARDDKQFQSALHAALNEARAQAQLKPVKLEMNQSQTNHRVAGQYFKSSMAGDESSADLIALGVMAGWNVNGAIRGGGVLPVLVPATHNPARFLGQILDDPTGRWVLFEPEAESVAIGARVLNPSGLVALMTTYSFFDTLDHRADEDAVFKQLAKVRSDNHLPAPVRINSTDVEQALAEVANGSSTTEDALNNAMEKVSAHLQRGVSGYVEETNDLKYLSFPDTFLQPGKLEIAVGVTHYKPPGAAWAQYALLFAVLLPDNTSHNTAQVIPSKKVALPVTF